MPLRLQTYTGPGDRLCQCQPAVSCNTCTEEYRDKKSLPSIKAALAGFGGEGVKSPGPERRIHTCNTGTRQTCVPVGHTQPPFEAMLMSHKRRRSVRPGRACKVSGPNKVQAQSSLGSGRRLVAHFSLADWFSLGQCSIDEVTTASQRAPVSTLMEWLKLHMGLKLHLGPGSDWLLAYFPEKPSLAANRLKSGLPWRSATRQYISRCAPRKAIGVCPGPSIACVCYSWSV